MDWETFLPLALAASAEEWDILSIGTAGIDYDLEGEEQVINFGAADIEAWRSGEAELLERV